MSPNPHRTPPAHWARSLLAAAALQALSPAGAWAQDAGATPAAAPATPTATPAAAAGQQQLQEVVVTSERRSSNLQKTPASITVKSGNAISQSGQNGLSQILEDVPGVSLNTQGSNSDSAGLSVVIRGVQPNVTAGGASSAPPSTAVYTDGIFNGIGGDYDLNRVEVLRGPQGTLYGRSATSGVVALHTHDPVLGRLGGEVLLEAGSDQLRHASGALNVGLGEQWALRVAVNELRRDGFDSPEGGASRSRGGRVKLLFQPSSDVRLVLGAAAQRQTQHTGGQTLVATSATEHTVSTGAVASQDYAANQVWAQLGWNLGWAELSYQPAWRNWDTNGEQIIGADIIRQTAKYPRDTFMTHELRLASNSAGPLKWLLGGFYYDNRYQNQTNATWIHSQALTWEQDVNKHTRNLGLFGEATYALRPDTRLTAGLRLDHTRVDTWGAYTQNTAVPAAGSNPFSSDWFLPEVLSTVTLTPEQGRKTFRNVTFKLRGEHDLDAAHSVYATASSGFLPGDSQFTTTSAGATALTYESERLMALALELGSKNRFLNNQLTLNASVFLYNYSGYQTTANTSGNPQNPSYAVVSSPARMWGGEVEGRWRLGDLDSLSFSLTHLNARYRHPSAEFQTYVTQTRIPGVAPTTVTLGAEHLFGLGDSTLRARLDLRYQGAYELGTMATSGSSYASWNRAEALTTLNGNLSWQSPSGAYTVTGYVRNVTDSRVRTSFSFQDQSITLSEPRTVGVVLQAKY